jgi:16S rRNA (cytosine967-C5)-methyltransferase
VVPTARTVAAEVIVRVMRDGAFAAAALDAELDRAVQLDPRDRGLATELVYGTLRYVRWLEARVARHAARGIEGLDPYVRAHLLLAAYQLFVLTRVPAFAVVNEAVDAVRAQRNGGPKVAGFANAVLRKLSREEKPDEAALSEAALASVEPSLRAAIVRAIGEEGARELVASHDAPPPLGIRVENAAERDEWLVRLRMARPIASFDLGKLSPLAILARGAGRIGDLPGYADGAWSPQEEGSQAVALALEAKPGEVVLDACAGRGNKTGLLARAVGKDGAVDAVDLHPKKLETLKKELTRIGVAPRATYAVDWSKGTGGIEGVYDGVLIDAPCSGTGTVRRRPELLLRRAVDDLAALTKLQSAILARAASLVKPGGRVIYAVCSVLREEAEDVVSGADGLGLEHVRSQRFLPHEHGTDGYFVAAFVRRP